MYWVNTFDVVLSATSYFTLRGAPREPSPQKWLDTGYGRSKKAKIISATNPARYFPASDELLYGPILGRKISNLIASFDSAA